MADAGPLAGLLLAAGRSRRFGDDDKLLAHLGGKPLFRHAADALKGSGVQSLLAVCKTADGPMAEQLRADGFEIIVNATDSQSRSLKMGAAEAFENGAGALLVVLADMPFVTADSLKAMIAHWQAQPGDKPLAAFNGEHFSPPVIFGRSAAPRLASLPDHVPGKSLLADATRFPMSPLELRDIDTVDEFEAAAALLR
jgi:molybdenum cofactor cytidylyltransferase